jgi:hypothetical protein
MKYYKIAHSIDLKETGDFPQSDECIYPGMRYSPKALTMLRFQKAPADVEIPKVKLLRKAKLIDFVSSNLSLLLVSTKLKDIIEQHNTFGYEWLPTSLVRKNEEYNNYWLANQYKPYTEALDLTASKFANFDAMIKHPVLEGLVFNTAEELNEAYENNLVAALVREMQHTPLLNTYIVLKEHLGMDFFFLRNTTGTYFTHCVSERLREKIEQEKCTGLIFMELNAKYP